MLASQFCRTRETARLAFGRATVHAALLNTITTEHNAAWRKQIRNVRRLFGTKPAQGRSRRSSRTAVVVSDTTGQTLEEGEALVIRPLGNSRYRIVGRVLAGEWATLRLPSSLAALRVREYPVPAGTHPHDVAPAPDGTVWYTAQHTGRLGRLDPSTGKVTEIPLGEGSAPHGVIVGPDGNAWVTDGGLNAIVRVDHRHARGEDLPAPGSRPATRTSTPRPSTGAGCSGSRGRAASTVG